MKNKVLICPHCHEANPLDAVMCFACFSALDESNIGTEEESRRLVKVRMAKTRQSISKWPSGEDIFAFSLIGLAFVSGWLPRRWRVPVLALSATTLGAMCAHASRYNAKYAHDDPPREEDDTAYRIAETVLYYSHLDKSPQIRMEVTPRIVDVFYFFEGEWRNSIKIPLGIWPAVREQIYRRVRAGQTRVNGFDAEQKPETVVFEISAHVEINRDGETMILNLSEIV